MSQTNRHQLTMKQHVFPEASIKRFLNGKGFVNVSWQDGKTDYRKPGSSMFLSDRAWEQRSETSTHAVETEFQSLASKIADNIINSLDDNQTKIVTEMACIWLSRWYLKHNPSRVINLGMAPPEVLKSIIPYGYINLDDYQDACEKYGLVAYDSNGTIHGRFQSYPRLRKHISLLRAQMEGLNWGIARSKEAEFIVPDVSLDGILPISPTSLLICGESDVTASYDDVSELNRRMRAGSREWYFGKCLRGCPFPKI